MGTAIWDASTIGARNLGGGEGCTVGLTFCDTGMLEMTVGVEATGGAAVFTGIVGCSASSLGVGVDCFDNGVGISLGSKATGACSIRVRDPIGLGLTGWGGAGAGGMDGRELGMICVTVSASGTGVGVADVFLGSAGVNTAGVGVCPPGLRRCGIFGANFLVFLSRGRLDT